jgi:hypothetical protein
MCCIDRLKSQPKADLQASNPLIRSETAASDPKQPVAIQQQST